jgi:FAS-associated factor 2
MTFWTLLRSPFVTVYRILTFFTSLIPFLSRFAVRPARRRRQLPPQDTASRFVRDFEERYGPHHVKFEERGYADVAKHVKENLLFLVVILISEEHDDTAPFCRDTLGDEGLKEWLQSNECIVWGGNVADAEAHTGIT